MRSCGREEMERFQMLNQTLRICPTTFWILTPTDVYTRKGSNHSPICIGPWRDWTTSIPTHCHNQVWIVQGTRASRQHLMLGTIFTNWIQKLKNCDPHISRHKVHGNNSTLMQTIWKCCIRLLTMTWRYYQWSVIWTVVRCPTVVLVDWGASGFQWSVDTGM